MHLYALYLLLTFTVAFQHEDLRQQIESLEVSRENRRNKVSWSSRPKEWTNLDIFGSTR